MKVIVFFLGFFLCANVLSAKSSNEILNSERSISTDVVISKKVTIRLINVHSGTPLQVSCTATVSSPEYCRLTAGSFGGTSSYNCVNLYNPNIGFPLSFSGVVDNSAPTTVVVQGYNFSETIYSGYGRSYSWNGIVPINPGGKEGDTQVIAIIVTH